MHSYDPGHLLLFRSADLWHQVMPWKPAVMTREMSVTPGCISLVFFTPGYSLQSAIHKPSRAGIRTGNEALRLPTDRAEDEQRPRKKKRTKKEIGGGGEKEEVIDGLEDATDN